MMFGKCVGKRLVLQLGLVVVIWVENRPVEAVDITRTIGRDDSPASTFHSRRRVVDGAAIRAKIICDDALEKCRAGRLDDVAAAANRSGQFLDDLAIKRIACNAAEQRVARPIVEFIRLKTAAELGFALCAGKKVDPRD